MFFLTCIVSNNYNCWFLLLNKTNIFEFKVIFIFLDAILAAILETACVAFRPRMPEWHSTDLSCTWPGHLKSIITFSIYPKTRLDEIMQFNVWIKSLNVWQPLKTLYTRAVPIHVLAWLGCTGRWKQLHPSLTTLPDINNIFIFY